MIGPLKPFVPVKDELSVSKVLLLRGNRLVILHSLQPDMLNRLHSGYQGTSKCHQHARQSVWWPAISKDIGNMISHACSICCKTCFQSAEPLILSPFPDYPRQRVASDIFKWNKQQYLLVIDYYSKFVEIAKLSTATSCDVINHLKSIFAQHSIPELLTSDNGTQYSAELFSKLAKKYGFMHLTSSPYHPQGNGAAERGVRTVKTLLSKSEDLYSALLAYRKSPLENRYNPAELLIGKKFRTTVPIISKQLLPHLPVISTVREKEEKI